MSVGKVYAGLLMVENYRTYKSSLAKYGEIKPQKSSFFNRLMGAVRTSTSQTPKPPSIGDENERFKFILKLIKIS